MRASAVTLHGDRPLADALAEISRQTGNQLKDVRQQMGQEIGNPQVIANFDKTPFWQALDQTLDQAGLTVYPYAGKDELGIMARAEIGFAAVEPAQLRRAIAVQGHPARRHARSASRRLLVVEIIDGNLLGASVAADHAAAATSRYSRRR